jgi:hypothetical protein
VDIVFYTVAQGEAAPMTPRLRPFNYVIVVKLPFGNLSSYEIRTQKAERGCLISALNN